MLAGTSAGALGEAGSRRPRRCAVAAPLCQAAGRAAARSAVAKKARAGGGRQAGPDQAADRDRPLREEGDALAGLERWKARHPEAAAHLRPADVLVDAMRGRSSTWTRVRVNL